MKPINPTNYKNNNAVANNFNFPIFLINEGSLYDLSGIFFELSGFARLFCLLIF